MGNYIDLEEIKMLKKIISLACVAILATTAMVGCNNNTADKNNTSSTTSTPTEQSVVSDPEASRVGTLDKFLNYRSITLNEKVLRFLLDDVQMNYCGFKIADTTGLDAIQPGQRVKNIKYVSDTGLTAYVAMQNDTNEVADYTKCKYYTLKMVKGDCTTVNLHLPNKLGWDATVDTFKSTYGTPSEETTDTAGNTVLKYSQVSTAQRVGYSAYFTVGSTGLLDFVISFYEVGA